MPLNDVLWTRPVTVRLQCGLERTFTSVYHALDFLENEWPLGHGELHQRAVKTCRGALNRVIAPLIAREAFMAACVEAGLPAVVAPWQVQATRRPARPTRVVALR
ncbi:DUF982 domain-containing protein [Rhizobium lentis]|uniref:DUF982 domain-containing protein n=1 Tax=Rhizobium lentis TaxID=1138194 RepID=A0A7W9CXC3_9HYPH|nr:DUF982 domain-containing protein [Rhizobium lentis]MBB4576348.1 hypothetical protein [Rhizobium lentis]MBB5552785.1 hypothetical protein [Rhizobium lentis]MBB5563325.1 hypothetical protein [Rhizobium lentis]MBB5569603.1 hypothetical protein [Rhizobium lentis]